MGKKVIIIGAGPGGLAAGMLLAHKGYSVRIYEKQAEVGGRNARIQLGEYTFDVGPTFFLMKDVLEDIFERCGRRLADHVELKELDPMYRLCFKGGRTFYPSRNPSHMREAMEAFSPGSFAGYEKYLREEKRKYDKLIPCLSVPYSSVGDFFTRQFISSLPLLDAHTSLYGVLSRYFSDPDVRIAFTFQAKYIGMSPWEAPGTFSIISYIEHGGGIYHVTGGLNQLSHSMAKLTREDGGEILTQQEVKRLIIEGGVAKGVELENGQVDTADHVIINADFAQAMKTLVAEEHRPKYTNAALNQKKYSCSTFMLYLGVNKRYDAIPHHNILFADDYQANVQEIVETLKLPENPSFYVQNASVTDPTLAPSGKSALYVLVPVPNNNSGIPWQEVAKRYRDKIIDLMETRGGFEGLREHIEEELVLTPEDWEKRDVFKGATFNLAHNIGQMLLWRPHNRFEEFDHCYLVGGGTHPGSGLPTIYKSAVISTDLILKQDGQ